MTRFTYARAALLRAVLERIERQNPAFAPIKTPYRDWMVRTVKAAFRKDAEDALVKWAVQAQLQQHTTIASLPEPFQLMQDEAKGTGRKQARDEGGWLGTLAHDIHQGLMSVMMQGDLHSVGAGWAHDLIRLYNMGPSFASVEGMLFMIQWEEPVRESRISEMESTWPYESASETREEYLERISAQRAAIEDTDEA
jgi:hypothetical protein